MFSTVAKEAETLKWSMNENSFVVVNTKREVILLQYEHWSQ